MKRYIRDGIVSRFPYRFSRRYNGDATIGANIDIGGVVELPSGRRYELRDAMAMRKREEFRDHRGIVQVVIHPSCDNCHAKNELACHLIACRAAERLDGRDVALAESSTSH